MAASRANGRATSDARLRFAPESQRALQEGIATLERVLGPTLGPTGHPVAIGRIGRPGLAPELLDDGGTIARRLTGLPDPFANMGLMLARHAAWRMRRASGDGAATAVTVLAATHRALLTYAAAGANPAALRRGTERATACAASVIEAAASPIAAGEIERFLTMNSGDRAVVATVTEAVALLGPEAVVVARQSRGRGVVLECVEGALWESPSIKAPLANDGQGRETRLVRPHVLVWDAPIDDPLALASVLQRLRSDGAAAVLLVARSFGSAALALLHRNAGGDLHLAAATAPHEGTQQTWALADIAALTGGRVCAPERGDSLDRLESSAVGAAQRAVVGPGYLNLLTTETETAAVARQRATIHHLMEATDDEQEWRRLQLRRGRLRQGMGVIWVGAATESERAARLNAAEQALIRLRGAMSGGVVPGGGSTFLAAAHLLRERAGECDEGLGQRAVATGLEAPARWLARNAGFDPTWAVHRITPETPHLGLDATTGEIRDLRAAGILDPAATALHALRIGASTAALAVTCEALVRRPIVLHQAEIRP